MLYTKNSPHILCLTEDNLQYSELALSHIENYTLGTHYRRNKKTHGRCLLYTKNIPFTCLEIGDYCKNQDIEIRGIQLNYDYDKLCILAVYRSPLGQLPNQFGFSFTKNFLFKFTFIICGDININYLDDSYKKKQLYSISYSFNICSIVNFPTRIGPSSLSTIDNVFIDNSYLNKYIAPVINGLSIMTHNY